MIRSAFGARSVVRGALVLASSSFLWACGQAPPRVETPSNTTPKPLHGWAPSLPDAGPSPTADAQTALDGGPISASSEDAAAPSPNVAKSTDGGNVTEPCPPDMRLVDVDYCPQIERTCVEEEYSPQNHITLCHRFAPEQRCLAPEEHRRFCIDEYEYPNKKGAHPPWMVSWYDAQATCGLQQKRVCYESEWVSACEGPNKTPFPYGYARDNAKCNIDNMWIEPGLAQAYSTNPLVATMELSRLDQSVPSGERTECVSGFGVRDMTGNFDEWVTADYEHNDKSQWAGLKGGAWGHVRNACRPVTTSHPPDFTYYFIAFRCCKDAADATPYVPTGNPNIPAVTPANRAPLPIPVYPPGPSAKKVGRENWGKPGAGKR